MLLSWEYLLVEFVTERLVKHDVLLQSLVSDPSLRESYCSISNRGGETCWATKATSPLTFATPPVRPISPSSAERREDLPAPTCVGSSSSFGCLLDENHLPHHCYQTPLLDLHVYIPKTLSNDILEMWTRISHLRTGTVFLLPQQNEAFFRVIGAGMASLRATPFFDLWSLFVIISFSCNQEGPLNSCSSGWTSTQYTFLTPSIIIY